VVDKVDSALNDDGKAVKGARILILGVAYKRDVNDVRESPAFEIIQQFASARRAGDLPRSVCATAEHDARARFGNVG